MGGRRDEQSTEELYAVQRRRETEERTKLDESATSDEAEQHRRRADKHAYLRQKLEERAESERRAAKDEEDGSGAPGRE
jgi:hypothetical protein